MPSTPLKLRLEVVSSAGRGLPQYARKRGVDIEPLATAHAVDVRSFEKFDVRMKIAPFADLLEALAAFTKDGAFGIKYGLEYQLGASGPFGIGVRSAPDLRSALEFAVKFIQLPSDVGHMVFEKDQNGARLEWGYSPILRQPAQFIDFVTATMIRHFKNCAGANWLPIAATLQRPAPPDVKAHREHISRDVTFGADYNGFSVSAASLASPNPNSDPLLFEMMTETCAKLLIGRPRRSDLRSRVESEVLELLGRAPPVVATVAPRLGMSTRNLQRRLAESGLTFQTIVDRVRKELSDELLADHGLTIAEVARSLGFSAPGAYSRSAMRWYGASPREVRLRLTKCERSGNRTLDGRDSVA